ncbi:craniofacial development protein 1 [Onthophagus taurus]|uniref:craniofacial development protein 1 n=1 Tax=Onthophagus taurus TaxID=166361 RepID=UPI000C20814C|nr:craniofacial development protein 1-like [Onthophagus taurus]XP_022908907.1 craniofacial development protein 1-like [Onthophagus taurus]
MNKVEYPEDSDTSDEDFDPGKTANEAVSEVDSDGDSEDPLSDKEDPGTRGIKRKKRPTKSRKKPKDGGNSDLSESPEKKLLTEEEQKKKVDDLWAMFKKDTSFKPKEAPQKPDIEETKENTKQNISIPKEEAKKETVKVTQIFEFAGEEVIVEKELPAKEAKLINKPSSSLGTSKRGGARSGGLTSLISQLGKKQKITTLEKSKLDWDKFKKEENLEDELHTFNKGKDGYLEKQDFLQRTDVRRFEIERDIRNIERNKRMNMNNID